MLKWLALAALSGFAVPVLAALEEPVLRLDSPVKTAQPSPAARPPFRYDPLHEPGEEGLKLDSPYYRQDAVKAALGYMPADTPLGPPDLADEAWDRRMERLGEISRAIGGRARHTATILGMECDLYSPLSYMCRVPQTDCVVGVGFPPVVLCPF